MPVKQILAQRPRLNEATENFLLDYEVGNRAVSTIEAYRIVLGFMSDYATEAGCLSLGN